MVKQKKWNEEIIEKSLKEYIKKSGKDRMPTRRELSANGGGLMNAIYNHHQDLYYWSKRLGYPMKPSNKTQGRIFEEKAKDEVEYRGHIVKLERQGHPWDLTINGFLKADAKSSNVGYDNGKRKHEFGISDKGIQADVYICYTLDEKGRTENVYVIPASAIAHIISTIKIQGNTYNQYINRFDIIDSLLEKKDIEIKKEPKQMEMELSYI